MTRSRIIAVALAGLLSLSLGQQALGKGKPSQKSRVSEMVTIDYPEQLPLEALVEYVSRTLDVRFLYREELRKKEVILRPGHVELPKDRLLDLLRSVLQVHDLALVPGELDGLYRITTATDAQRHTGEIRTDPPAGEPAPGVIVTQVIKVPSGNTKAAINKIKDFTSSSKSSVVEVAEQGLIVVTDYEPVVARIAKLIEVVEAAPDSVVTEVVDILHQDPSTLATQVSMILEAETPQEKRKKDSCTLAADILPGKVVVVADKRIADRAIELLHRFDIGESSVSPTRVYTPRHTSAQRIKQLVDKLILGKKSKGGASSSMFIDDTLNRLYVTASPVVHQRIEELLETEDHPQPESARRMRIYRPHNRTAAEILDTLTQLLEEALVVSSTIGTTMADESGEEAEGPPGPNRPPVSAGAGQVPPMPPAQEPIETEAAAPRTVRRLQGPDYVLTEDEPTNSIIAIGSPEFHAQLEELIKELDRRRAQVMIEMQLVAVTMSDGLDLGIELESLDLGGGWDYLLFSGFDLSKVDAVTGQRALAPGVGLNGILIGPEEMPIVIKALATHADSRVVSMPRLLVSDNTTSTLRNVEEAPFTSVNASDTVATTSFGGFESAGTTLTVTPHVAEGDHLGLDYNLTFSSFGGNSADATVPPPRTTNSFTGEVQVPDGYTVVVGGLEVDNTADTVSEVPLLGRIPVLGALFQSSAASRSRTRVFAFIRPVVLRDDQFKDLKFISAQAMKKAELENKDYPPDRLMWMR